MSKYKYSASPEAIPQQIGNTAVIQQETMVSREPSYVAGVDVGGTNLRLAMADRSGKLVAKWSSSTVGLRGPDAVIHLICEGVKNTLSQVSAAPSALRSIAIGIPGVTDIENGIVIATSYLMGWQNVPLRTLIEKELKVPALVDNDVNMAAIGESWCGAAKGVRDFVFLAIGTGVGAGIILNGRPHRGISWSAGEIGYMLVPGVTTEPEQDNDPGALESMIGGEGIKAQWQKLWNAEQTSLPKELNATEIFDHALDGDSQAQAILQQSATMLAQAIYNISLVLNCQLFVLGGSVGMHPVLIDAAQKVLRQWHVRGGLRLIRSSLGADAQLLGAIRSALDKAAAHPISPALRSNSI